MPLDPTALLATLSECGVEFVLVGAMAINVYAEVRPTGDLDIMVPVDDEANKVALGRALRRLDAELIPTTEGGIAVDAEHPTYMFRTRYGKLDVLYRPDGSAPYAQVKQRANHTTLGGRPIQVAAKGDLVRMKLAAGRAHDLEDVANLTAAEQGAPRRIFVSMQLAPGVDEDWSRDLAQQRIRLFDPRGRVWIDDGYLKLEAQRADLTEAQLRLWAQALSERLRGSEILSGAEPAVEIDSG